MVLLKLAGIVMLILAYIFIRHIPSHGNYQRGEMVQASLLIGVISLILGIVLLLI